MGIYIPPRYVNWSLNRKSPWHRAQGDSKKPLCGLRVKNHPEWSHGARPCDIKARFCEKCELEARHLACEQEDN